MEQLMQAADIAIIGGADGPTNIYICSSLWKVNLLIALFIIAVVFSVYGLIKSVRKRNVKGLIIFSILNVIFTLIIAYSVFSAISFLNYSAIINPNFSDTEQTYTMEENFTEQATQ